MKEEKDFLVAVYGDDDDLIEAIPKIKDQGAHIYEAYTPFPVHGLESLLGYKKSRLDIAAFMYGVIGCATAIILQTYTMGFDWPMVIGGKDYVAFPDFIPVTFELTVLATAVGLVTTFFIVSSLFPGSPKEIFDKRATDDKFLLAFDLSKNHDFSAESLQALLKDSGAEEVNAQKVKI